VIRDPDLHDLFGQWITTRAAELIEDPPRDLALHAAGCDRCLRLAAAIDMLDGIDVGAAAIPPLITVPTRNEPGTLGPLARSAAISAALVLGAATAAAVGSSWLAGARPAGGGAQPSSPGEGVLAGVPSETASSRPTPSRTTRASQRETPTPEPSGTSPDESPALPAFLPPPPPAPLPPPPTTTPATAAPSITAAPTPTATLVPSPTAVPTVTPDLSPTQSPSPTPTSTPTPTPTPTGP
jgi:hypothetical protein